MSRIPLPPDALPDRSTMSLWNPKLRAEIRQPPNAGGVC